MKRLVESDEECIQLPVEMWMEISKYLDVPDCIRLTSITSSFYPLLPEMVLVLELDYTGGSNAILSIGKECFKRLCHLKTLELGDSEEIEDDDLLSGEWTSLKMLDLDENKTITNKGLQHLTSLSYLKLGNNFQITGDALRGMKNLTCLNLNLFLSDDSDDDSDIERIHPIDNETLANLSSLTYLDLSSNNAITLDGLIGVKNLKALQLAGDHLIKDSDLLKLTNLEVLELMHDLEITGQYAESIANLTDLRLLGCTIFKAKNVAKLTSLVYLDLRLSSPTISDDTLMSLTNLTYLDIGYDCPEVTERSITKLTKLSTLILDCTSQLKMSSLAKLKHLTNLCVLCPCEESSESGGEGLGV